MRDGLTALILGAYLLAVAWRGNSETLKDKLAGERGFVVWGLVLWGLWTLYENTRERAVLGLLIAAFVGFFIRTGARLFPNLQRVMQRLTVKG